VPTARFRSSERGGPIGSNVHDDSVAKQFIVIKIRSRPVQCLVDSGSVISVVSHSLVLKLKLRMQETASTTPLLAATGQPLKVLGSVDITFQVFD